MSKVCDDMKDDEVGVEAYVDGEEVDKVELGTVDDAGAEELALAMLMQEIRTSFAFSWLISRLAGTLPRLVDTVEADNKIDPDAFPLLFFSDCVPPCFTRSMSCTLLSPTSGANSDSSAEYRLDVDTGAFSVTTGRGCRYRRFVGATL